MLGLERPLSSGFDYIFAEDSAIDQNHSDYDPEAYEEDLDPKHLPLKPGERPTVFQCKPLGRVALAMVKELVEQDRRMDAQQVAVQYGLSAIKDGPPELAVERDKTGRIKTSTMDGLFEHFGLVTFFPRLANAIVNRSNISPF